MQYFIAALVMVFIFASAPVRAQDERYNFTGDLSGVWATASGGVVVLLHDDDGTGFAFDLWQQGITDKFFTGHLFGFFMPPNTTGVDIGAGVSLPSYHSGMEVEYVISRPNATTLRLFLNSCFDHDYLVVRLTNLCLGMRVGQTTTITRLL